jgi:hypothetical protein
MGDSERVQDQHGVALRTLTLSAIRYRLSASSWIPLQAFPAFPPLDLVIDSRESLSLTTVISECATCDWLLILSVRTP